MLKALANDRDGCLIESYDACQVVKSRFCDCHSTDSEIYLVSGTSGTLTSSVELWKCPHPKTGFLGRKKVVSKVATASHAGDILGLEVYDSSTLVTASSQGAINVYSIDEQGLKKVLSQIVHQYPTLRTAPCNSISIQESTYSSKEVVTAGADGRISFVKIDNPNVVESYNVDSMGINDVEWISQYEVACVNNNGVLKVFDRRDCKKPVLVSSSPCGPLHCIVSNSSKPTELAAGGKDGSVTVWDVRNKDLPSHSAFKIHSHNVWEVLFHPTRNNHIISCAREGVSFQWETNREDRTPFNNRTILGNEELGLDCFSVNSVDYHEHAKMFLFATDAQTICIIEDNEELY